MEGERRPKPLEELLSDLTEAKRKIIWASLVRNNFKRRSQIRKAKNEALWIADQIIDATNCTNLILSVLIPPNLRLALAQATLKSGKTPKEGIDPLIRSYLDADEEGKQTIELMNRSYIQDPNGWFRSILDQVPPVAQDAFRFRVLFTYEFEKVDVVDFIKREFNPSPGDALSS